MFTNLLGIVLRQARRNPFYMSLNLLGLTLGITCCLTIGFYVKYELSFDQFHTKSDRIYRVNYDITMGDRQTISPSVPVFVAPHLKQLMPEIDQVTRLVADYGDRTMRYNDKIFDEGKFAWADSTFFDVFDFKAVRGDLKRALSIPGTLIITASMAKKYFADEDPIGKNITINNTRDYEVLAVMEDVPPNSTFRFDFLTSIYSINNLDESVKWSNPNYATFLLLQPGVDHIQFAKKIDEWVNPSDANHGTGNSLHLPIERLDEIHFDVTVFNYGGQLATTARDQLYIFISIGVLILVIACINYVNLATARSVTRAREVGLRKTVGATFKSLVIRFLAESFFMVLPAVLLSLVATAIMLPLISEMMGKQIPYDFTNPYFVMAMASSWVVISLLSGFYPAIVLARFKAISVLKGQFTQGTSGWAFRKGLIIVQFVISCVMISSTIILVAQLNFIQSKELGLDKDHVFLIRSNNQLGKNLPSFAEEVRKISGVQEASITWRSPFSTVIGNGLALGANPGDDAQWLTAGAIYADEHYIPTLGMTLKSGRNFDPSKYSGEKVENEFIVNETFLNDFGIDPETAIGSKVMLGIVAENGAGTIVGVVKDFHTASLAEKMAPVILFNDPSFAGGLLVRASGEQMANVLGSIEEKWKAVVPGRPFNFSFLDDQYDSLYATEMRLEKLVSLFSMISIGIACFGLLGLSSYTAVQRAREIGVRKVLGATTGSIMLLISGSYLRLMMVASLIALPIIYFAMDSWLNRFAYHVELSPLYFAGGVIVVMFIAGLTVGYHSVKASTTNPAESLKYE